MRKNDITNTFTQITKLCLILALLFIIVPKTSANESFDTLHKAIIDSVTTEITLTGDAEATTGLGFVGSKSAFTIDGNKFGINGNEHSGISTNLDTYQILIIKNVGDAKVAEGDDGKLTVTVNKSFGGFKLTTYPYSGGVVKQQTGTLTITDSVFTDNSVSGDDNHSHGGVVDAMNSKVTIENSVFYNNTAATSGGAVMAVDNSNVEIKGSDFVDNKADSAGGAVYLQDTSANIENSRFSGNEGTLGGAVYSINGDSLTVKNSEFRNNTSSDFGGAIYSVNNETVVIEDSRFLDNTSNTTGAVAINKSDTADESLEVKATIKGSTFEGNRAEETRGGAVTVSGLKELNIDEGNSFKSNYAKDGGAALYVQNTETINIADGTVFEDNNAGNYGGAIFAIADDGIESVLNIGNDVQFLGNSAKNGAAIYAQDIKEINIGEGATFADNTTTGTIFYFSGVEKVSIGEKAIFDGNKATVASAYSSADVLDAYAKYSTKSTNTFSIGSDSVFKNNSGSISYISDFKDVTFGDRLEFSNNTNNNKGYVIGVSGADICKIGDDLKITNNTGYNYLIYDNYCSGDNCFLEIGNNATITGNKTEDGYYTFMIHGNYFKNINIGDNLSITDNSGYMDIILTYLNRSTISTNTFTLGDNANISNNSTAKSAEMVDTDNVHKVTIGDNLKMNDNKGYYELWAVRSGDNVEFSIGKNAEIQNNECDNRGYSIFYLTDIKDFSIDDNLLIKNNKGYNHLIYIFSSGNGFSLSLSNNTVISENINSSSSSGYAIYAGSYNKVDIGEKFQFTDNVGYGYIINSHGTGADSSFTLGDNAYINNNKSNNNYGNAICVYSFDKVSIGENFTFADNEGYAHIIYSYGSSDNSSSFTLGDNAKIIGNNSNSNSAEMSYISSYKNVDIGENFSVKDNKNYTNGIVISLSDDSKFNLGKNAEFINNVAYTDENPRGNGGGLYLCGSGIFNIEDGALFKDNISGNGGAIYVVGYSQRKKIITIGKSIFSGNQANNNKYTYDGYGGAIYSSDAKLIDISDETEFTKNSAYRGGGAIYAKDISELNIGKGTKFSENSATAGYGGAIYAEKVGTLNIGENSEFVENKSTAGGAGAIYNNNVTTLNIGNNTKFSTNTINGGYGNALYLNNAKEIFIGDNVIFENNNSAGGSGGAIYASGNTESLSENVFEIGDGSVFYNNTFQSGGNGTALYIQNFNKINIGNNVTFEDNLTQGGSGGAIYADGNSATQDTNIFTIGDNAKFINNGHTSGGSASAISAARYNNLTIGNNALFDNNKTSSGTIYTSGVKEVIIGDNATFTNNSVVGCGAAIYYYGPSTEGGRLLKIGDNALFDNNNNGSSPGTIYATSLDNLIIGDNATFSNNNGSPGAAIYTSATNNYIGKNAKFISNTGTAPGAAIFSSGDLYVSEGALFKENKIKDSVGGAIYLYNNKAALIDNNALFLNNHANNSGGAIFQYKNSLFIKNAKFIGNSSKDGGAIAGEGFSVIFGSDFIKNSSENNGGANNIASGNFISFVDSDMKNNTAGNLGGAIYYAGTGTSIIMADKKDVTFSGNTDSTGANDIYNSGTAIYINSTNNKTITFDGSITGNDEGTLHINNVYGPNVQDKYYDSETNSLVSSNYKNLNIETAKGTIVFNNTVSGNSITHGGGTIKLGNNQDAIGNFDIKKYETRYFGVENKLTLNSANNKLQDIKIENVSINSTAPLNFILDIDIVEQKADRIVNNSGSGIITIEGLNLLTGSFEDIPQDLTDKEFIIQILKNLDEQDNLQLALSENGQLQLGDTSYKIGTQNEIEAEKVKTTTNWDEKYILSENKKEVWGKLRLADKDTTNDSIGITVNGIKDAGQETKSLGDTFAVVNQSTDEANKILKASGAKEKYILTDNLGETTGNVTVQGSASGNLRSTVDMNSNKGFELENDNSVVTLKDVKVENGATLATSYNKSTTVVLDNAEITNNGTGIQTEGSVAVKGDSKINDNVTVTDKDSVISITAGNKTEVSKTLKGTSGAKLNVEHGKLTFARSAKVTSLDTTLKNTNITLKEETTLNENNVTVDGATALNTSNGKTGDVKFETLNLKGKLKMNVDADLKNQKMDTISAKTANVEEGAGIGVKKINLTSPTTKKSIKILFTDNKDIANAVTYEGKGKVSYSPIYKYKLGYKVEDDMGYFTFNRAGGSNPGVNDYNPAIFASPIATLTAGFLTQSQTLQDGFYHMNTYTKYNKSDRFAAENINRYALNQNTSLDREVAALNLSTKNSGDAGEMIYRKESLPETSHAMWVKPYTSFERVNLRGGIGVNNISYGALYGGDSDMKQLRNGWKGVMSAFIGYTGSYQTYRHNNTITQNGGVIGVTGTLYKGNFFTGLTLSTGASAGEADTMFGTDHFSMLTAGIANKTGYNWELAKGRFIVQPSIFLGYIFANTFDYKNAAGVKMNSDALHAIQIAPGVKFIGNTKKGWQPYLGVDMVWNILGDTKFMANDTRLPELSVKPYVQYGLGLQKTWSDRFTAYFQTMIRNGGRNGVVLQGGFRWAIGK